MRENESENEMKRNNRSLEEKSRKMKPFKGLEEQNRKEGKRGEEDLENPTNVYLPIMGYSYQGIINTF